MEQTLTKEEFTNLIKLNEKAVEYFNLSMDDISKALDLSEVTRKENENPADFHKSRREAITRVVMKCREELQKRENELQYYGSLLKADKIYENKEKSEEVLDRELNELVNGKYPITLYINQIFNIVMEAEKRLNLFRILPLPAYKI